MGAQYKWRSKTITKEKKQTQYMSEKVEIPTSSIYISNNILKSYRSETSEVLLNKIPLQKNKLFLKTYGKLKIIGKT